MTAKADRLTQISVSPIMQMITRIAELRAAGTRIYDLSVGESDFPTPDHVIAAATRAMRDGQTRYTSGEGTLALRTAILERIHGTTGVEYIPQEIIVSSGAKQVIHNAIQAFVNGGDEVIIPTPSWLSYGQNVQLAGGIPVYLPGDPASGYRINLSALQRAITKRTRCIVINNPNNPTGAVHDSNHLKSLLEILRQHPNVIIIIDEIYQDTCFASVAFTPLIALAGDLKNRIVTVNGVSKSYAMTGWRLGWASGPANLIANMAVVQNQVNTCASSISQAAAIAALQGPQDLLAKRARIYGKRAKLMLSELGGIPGVRCAAPQGTFFVFPEITHILQHKKSAGLGLNSDVAVAKWLLETFHVATIAGSTFGCRDHLRLSFVNRTEDVITGCQRLRTAFESLA